MKRILSIVGFSILVLLQGCIKDQVMTRTTVYRPEYKTKDEVRANIKSSTPIELTAPGKLFYKDGYVFLNELNKGVHIIDVRNPSAPNNIAFVHVPGAVDLAVRGNILYADMYTDLVAIDITDPKAVQLKTVVPGVFPERYYSSFVPDSKLIITAWIAVDTVLNCSVSPEAKWIHARSIHRSLFDGSSSLARAKSLMASSDHSASAYARARREKFSALPESAAIK